MGKANRFIHDEEAQMTGPLQAVMGLIMIGILIFIGIMVMSGVYDSNDLEENDTFYEASESVAEGTESAFTMTGTLMFIIVAGAVLSVLFGYFAFIR